MCIIGNRVKELIEANNAEVARRRAAEGQVENLNRLVQVAAEALAEADRLHAESVGTWKFRVEMAEQRGTRALKQLNETRANELAGLEERVAEWVRTRIGEAHMHRKERSMRLLEEAVELVQAEGIDYAQSMEMVHHVYDRPAGEPEREAAGVAVTLLGWCAATGNRLMDLAQAEVERIEKKPGREISESVARKPPLG